MKHWFSTTAEVKYRKRMRVLCCIAVVVYCRITTMLGINILGEKHKCTCEYKLLSELQGTVNWPVTMVTAHVLLTMMSSLNVLGSNSLKAVSAKMKALHSSNTVGYCSKNFSSNWQKSACSFKITVQRKYSNYLWLQITVFWRVMKQDTEWTCVELHLRKVTRRWTLGGDSNAVNYLE